ncbi:MAG: histidine kinase [Brevundimonas sp.]
MARRALRAWRALPTTLRDGVFAALLLVEAVRDAIGDDERNAAVVVLAVIAAAAVAWRRSRPLMTLVVTSAALCVSTAIEGAVAAGVTPTLVAVYSAIAWGRRLAGTSAAIIDVIVVGLAVGVRSGSWVNPDVLAVAAILPVAVAAGFAVESRRATIRNAAERVARAEQTRELEAARRVAEERLRIARELHDVLGHHVAVIGVQAGVAEMLLDSDVAGARAALSHVQDATESVLGELGALVEVLRDTDDDLRAAPAQGLAVLDSLLADVRSTGLVLEVSVVGDERALAPVVDLTAFRVIQEALTNAHKHGTGGARLLLRWLPETLTIEVTNHVADSRARADGGHGLVGMRERVVAVGGSLVAAPEGSTYRVHVTLPTLPAPVAPATNGAP